MILKKIPISNFLQDHLNINWLKSEKMIKVNVIDSTTFEVVVEDRITTTHRVTVPANYYRKLTNNLVSPEVLVEKSFEFLLEREPNTSILRSFELSVISRYFPEYENVIRKGF